MLIVFSAGLIISPLSIKKVHHRRVIVWGGQIGHVRDRLIIHLMIWGKWEAWQAWKKKKNRHQNRPCDLLVCTAGLWAQGTISEAIAKSIFSVGAHTHTLCFQMLPFLHLGRGHLMGLLRYQISEISSALKISAFPYWLGRWPAAGS